MSKQITHFNKNLLEYIREKGVRESTVLKKLRDRTAELPNSNMQIMPELGQLLKLLVSLTGSSSILEIGTYTGYSALAMARGLPKDGVLMTCDIDEETTDIADRYWKRAGVQNQIDLRIKPAKHLLQELREANEEFDMIFLDADKKNYVHYYEKSLPLLRSGGLLIVDNVLWSGKVTEKTTGNDPKTETIRELNERIHADERVSISMLPLGDGVTLAMKRHDQ